jgi:hypothetical protein
MVYQPEDVHLVRDLLELETRPIQEVLKINRISRPDGNEESDGELEPVKTAFVVNTQMTPMGRPVNVRPQVRWKSITNSQPPPSAETNLLVQPDTLQE